MVDAFSKAERSRIMRAVHSTGTRPERTCETLLRDLKISYLRNVATLPGRPDFVLRASRLALFVHGCFWHSHSGCDAATLPKSNAAYWHRKVDRNRRRDRRVREALRKLGWRTAVVWECQLANSGLVARRLVRLSGFARAREKLR